jgi:hypothetical protein
MRGNIFRRRSARARHEEAGLVRAAILMEL